jgi:glutamyl-tRNA synthetase
VGTARSALYNWLYARQKGGRFILRIEDTDFARSSAEMSAGVLESLEWLGLSWDEGPYYQSQRLQTYSEYAQKLAQAGGTYSCYCQKKELAARKESALKKGRAWKYDRKCLGLSKTEKAKLEAEGVPSALRFRVPDGKTEFTDGIHGVLEKDNSDIEDFVIVRSNGKATYNFAVVVDDYDMRISHVIRGDDHISNTFKQVLLYNAVGLAAPHFYHLPLILAEDKSKLSKRHGAVSVLEFRESGYLPEALVNFLALLGWSPGSGEEMLSMESLIRDFSFERVIKRGAVFDRAKLEWMNGQYINNMTAEELLRVVLPFLRRDGIDVESLVREREDWLKDVLILLRERARTLKDFASLGTYFFRDAFDYDERAVKKHFSGGEVAQRLRLLRDRFSGLHTFSGEETERALRELAAEQGLKAAALIHPARVALTGMQVGPGLFDIVELLGRERVLARLDRAASFVDNMAP